jgi:ribosomal protein S18 acetylase RimI-like enzyme
MVGQRPLKPFILVRIQVWQHMNIRELLPEEANIVLQASNATLAHHQVLDAFYSPVKEDAPVAEKVPLQFAAYTDDSLLQGVVSGVVLKNPKDRSVPYATLQNVWVEPAYRSLGVAQALVAQFETAAKTHGAALIDINVDVHNELALEFWNAAGYTIYQERRRKPLT